MAETEEAPPRRALLGLTRLRRWLSSVLRAHLTPAAVGAAVAIGVFIGVLPIYGLHFVACVLTARWLKLNQAILYTAANVSNPVFAPFLVAAEIQLGGWLRRRGEPPPVVPPIEGSFLDMLRQAPELFWDCMLGSLVIGVVAAPLLGMLAAWGLQRWRQSRPENLGDGATEAG